MPDPYHTAVLSGPEPYKRALEVALSTDGGVVDTPLGTTWHGFQSEPGDVRWVRVIHRDLGRVVELAGRFHEWRLRAHHPTPACGVCDGNGAVKDTGVDLVCLHCKGLGVTHQTPPRRDLETDVDELKRQLAALKGA